MAKKKRAPRDDNKKSLPQLRKKLWRLISQHILGLYRNKDGSIDCFTCGTNIPPGGKADAGHFLPKKLYKAHYFNLDAIRPQCFRCNGPGQGEQLLFAEALTEEIGEDEVADIWDTRHKDWPTDKQWYIDMIRELG